MKSETKNWIKYVIGFGICFFVRLIPFRPPNIEPILATAMPFGKEYGKIAGFLFAFFSIVIYDIVTGNVGMWTLVTAVVYGFLGIWAAIYFKNRKNTSWNYVKFAIMGTLVFDIVTGFSVGPLFFHQSFVAAVVGQIPFTGLHLLGNIIFAAILSPALYQFVVQSKKLEKFSFASLLKINYYRA